MLKKHRHQKKSSFGQWNKKNRYLCKKNIINYPENHGKFTNAD
jgi:hypothetical protein